MTLRDTGSQKGFEAEGSRIEAAIRSALAERRVKLDRCPVRDAGMGNKPCPSCNATTAGPCWINVEADAAFVDTIKELVV